MRSITLWKVDTRKIICIEKKGIRYRSYKQNDEEESFSNSLLRSTYITIQVTSKSISNRCVSVTGSIYGSTLISVIIRHENIKMYSVQVFNVGNERR
jgi:hypothetical protein